MSYTIITNNSKVFNFYKETDDILFLDNKNLEEILNFVYKKTLEGFKVLSDPILYNVENPNNPFKSILISKTKNEDNHHSINLMTGVLEILKKIPTSTQKTLNEIQIEEFRFVDLNLIRDSIEKIL